LELKINFFTSGYNSLHIYAVPRDPITDKANPKIKG